MKDKQLQFECPLCGNDTLHYEVVKASTYQVILEEDGSISEDSLPYDYGEIDDPCEENDFYCGHCKVTYYCGDSEGLADKLREDMEARESGVMSEDAENDNEDNENDNKELS